MSCFFNHRACSLGLLLLAIHSSPLRAQSTAFSYQGRLNDSTGPAAGTYDLTFALYGTPAGGIVVGGPLTNSAVSISNGFFSVSLDFGSAVFDGADRWIEIGVRSNGTAAPFTTLSPRQHISRTPYAVHALTLPDAAVTSAKIVDGSVSLADLNTSSVDGRYVRRTGDTFSGNVNMNGFRITGLASATASGDAVPFQQAIKSGQSAGGDLTGSFPSPTVAGLQGRAVVSTAPANGQVLAWNNSATRWEPTTPSTPSHGSLSGLSNDDHPQYLLVSGARSLAGNLNAGGFKITGLASATANGDAVPFQQAVKTGDSAGGDLGNTFPSPRVTGLQGRPLASTAPTTGQLLMWNNSLARWEPGTPPVPSHGSLSGLSNDDHPQYLLASGARSLSGHLSAGGFKITGLANATASGDAVPFQQAVKFGDAAGGDLANTFPSPRVTGLQGRPLASTAPSHGQAVVWNSGAARWEPASPAIAAGSITATHLATDANSLQKVSGDVLHSTQGRIGFGTNSPVTRFHLFETNAVGNAVRFERSNIDAAGGWDLVELILPTGTSGTAQFIECQLGNLDFKFRVNADGNVTADGTYTSGGADYAELVPVSAGPDSVEPGDVIEIDPENPRAFRKATSARSKLVAGVYSTKPGILGSEHDWDTVARQLNPQTGLSETPAENPIDLARKIGEVPVAMLGLVPCKVSAENGPIEVGDLLVTSATPGHAMRDELPRPGTIVGKALEPLGSGTGVIRVLVTLQ